MDKIKQFLKYFKFWAYPKPNKNWHFEFKITIPLGKERKN
jgi:hypothetical protein